MSASTTGARAPATGGALLATMLADYGVEYVFGVPSEAPQFISPLFELGSPRYVVFRDERAAPFAANVYAKLTGRLAVLDAAPSVGTTMMLPGLAEAFNASIPMLCIFTEVTQRAGALRRLGALNQATDQESYLRPVVKHCARVDSVGALPSLLRQAVQMAVSGRPGPVVLLVPYDVLEAEAPSVESGTASPGFARMGSLRSAPSPDGLRNAADLLACAERPVILAGGGVLLADAQGSLIELAEQIQMPVTTTLSGAGAIDEYHPLALGTAGFYGLPCASQAIERADVLVLAGMKSTGYATWFWRHPRPHQRVIHLDVDPVEPGKTFAGSLALVGDAQVGLQLMRASLPPISPNEREAWLAEVGRLRTQTWDEIGAEQVRTSSSTSIGTSAVRVAAELDARMRPGDVLICEASQTTGWASRVRLPVGARRITFRGLGILGGSIGGSIGGRLSTPPGARVIQFLGDGAMGYQIGELATLARLEMRVIVIVLNNSSLGAVHNWPGMPAGSADIGRIDFAAAARACGVAGLRVEDSSELGPVLDEAFTVEGPVLVDVVSDREEWSPLLFGDNGIPEATFAWGE